MGLTGICYRLMGDMVEAFHLSRPNSTQLNSTPQPTKAHNNDLVARALTAVFGMDTNGKIKKENARRVVEKLGLIHTSTTHDDEEIEECSFDLDEDVHVDEVLRGLEEEDESKNMELLREAFKIFDEDGDGFIEAVELKRVLDCLGLDYGWDMGQIEKMVQVVDLNLDGKVDFGEFELMMGVKNIGEA